MLLNLICLLPIAGTVAVPGGPPPGAALGHPDQSLGLAFAKALRSIDSTATGYSAETVDGIRSPFLYQRLRPTRYWRTRTKCTPPGIRSRRQSTVNRHAENGHQ